MSEQMGSGELADLVHQMEQSGKMILANATRW